LVEPVSQPVALVTGGGGGIGRGVALGLAARGYAVAVAGRRADALAETLARAGDAGERMLAVPTDVSDPAQVTALFDAVRARFGRLDLLFNNAGTFAPPVPLDELPVEAWNKVVGVNLTAAFLCTQAAFRIMKAQQPRGGRIINNGSISAEHPRPRSAPYTATKHALTGLTKSTALDGREYDIACGQIDIGNVASEMTGAIAHGVRQADGRVMAEPMLDIAHVVDAVVYMAGLPLEANVLFLTVSPSKMPFIGRG
jgi:NAD(P)-dependent dehydrogenase (short-subunit alcohol dehydrogenase family)